METIRELIPFVLGALVVPLITRLSPINKTKSLVQLAIVLLVSAVVGFLGSALVGEQIASNMLPERVVALVIDTSLAYTGAQIADVIFWKRVVAGLKSATP